MACDGQKESCSRRVVWFEQFNSNCSVWIVRTVRHIQLTHPIDWDHLTTTPDVELNGDSVRSVCFDDYLFRVSLRDSLDNRMSCQSKRNWFYSPRFLRQNGRSFEVRTITRQALVGSRTYSWANPSPSSPSHWWWNGSRRLFVASVCHHLKLEIRSRTKLCSVT